MQGKMIRFVVGRFSFRNRGTHSVTHGLSIFRLAPAQRFCQVPPGCWWHFVPSGFQCAGNFPDLRVFFVHPALFALISFPGTIACHTLITRNADWWVVKSPGMQGK